MTGNHSLMKDNFPIERETSLKEKFTKRPFKFKIRFSKSLRQSCEGNKLIIH